MEKLNQANVGLNLQKCKFAQQEVEWLGYKLTQSGITPLRSKIDGVLQLRAPRTLKQLRGLMGSAHQLNKFVPNLAQLCSPFRTLLQHKEKFKWEPSHDVGIERVKQAMAKMAQNSHFRSHAETRVTCDASKAGLGAVLEQYHDGAWAPIAFASRFLNAA